MSSFVAVSLGALAASCSVYNTSLLQDAPEGGTGGAGVGGAAGAGTSCQLGSCWWSGEQANGCFSVGAPGEQDRPDPAGIDPTELPPFYLGVERMMLGTTLPDGTPDANAWQLFGLDLDGVCTNSSTCPSVQDAVSCVSPSPQIPFDGEDCRDNTFAKLQPVAGMIPQIGQTFGLSEDAINCGIWNGAYSIIAKISGYNGAANDDNVRVDFYASPGTETDPGWECPLDDFRNLYPRWLVSRRWLIAEDDFATPPSAPGEIPPSKYADPAAFVRDHYFVARLPDGSPLNLPGDNYAYPGFNLRLHQGIWAGRIEEIQDGTWRIEDGLSAGRVTKENLIQAFRDIGFCEDQMTFYDVLLDYVEQNADVLSSGANDPTLPCDAMSVGISFVAAEVTAGMPVKLKPPPGCPTN